MAYSEWLIAIRSQAGPGIFANGTLPNGEDGAARINSALSDPLTASGDFCREYDVGSGSRISITTTISSSVSGGLFTEIPDTKAVSVRANIRIGDANSANNCIAIGAKMNPSVQTEYRRLCAGYHLVLGRTLIANTPGLKFYARGDIADATLSSSDLPVSYTNDTWAHVRMDVTPQVGQDKIDVYTGSLPEGGTWELVYTTTILNTDSHYVPWAQSGQGKIGYSINAQSTGPNNHIDNFEAYVVDV